MVNFFIGLLIFTFAAFSAYGEDRIKVAILDTGLSAEQAKQPYMCKTGVWTSFKDNGLDDHGHGTNIVGIISKNLNAKKYCIVSIKAFSRHTKAKDVDTNVMAAYRAIAKIKPAYLNLSMDGTTPILDEYLFIRNFLLNGMVIAVAAGNNAFPLRKDSCNAYPSCYKYQMPSTIKNKYYVIGASDTNSSNRGEIVNYYLPGYKKGKPAMTGTSQATAIFMSYLVSK